MKKRNLYFIVTVCLFISINGFAQRKTNDLFVLYSYNNNSTLFYKQWFNNKELLYTFLEKLRSKEIMVLDDGKIIKTTDSVKYKHEFEDWHKAEEDAAKNNKQPLIVRKHNSNITYQNGWDISNKIYLLQDTLQEMSNWEIYTDTLNILGFTCQKATTSFKGTIYTAYFTTSLPYSGGPKNFRGLPGLILKVESETGKIGYTAIEIQYPAKENKPTFNWKAKKITKPQFQEILKEKNKVNTRRFLGFGL
jgi:GLPGLI family protein